MVIATLSHTTTGPTVYSRIRTTDFWETFHDSLNNSQSFCQKSAKRKLPKKYFSYFFMMPGLGLETLIYVLLHCLFTYFSIIYTIMLCGIRDPLSVLWFLDPFDIVCTEMASVLSSLHKYFLKQLWSANSCVI